MWGALIVAVAFVASFVAGIANCPEYDGASDSEIILGQTIPLHRSGLGCGSDWI